MFTLRNQIRPIVAFPVVAPSIEVIALIARMRALAVADAELARLIEELETGVVADQRLPVDLPA